MLLHKLAQATGWSYTGTSSNCCRSGASIIFLLQMTYLGATLYADGGVKRELNRKLGAAWADFSKLARLWNHASLLNDRRIRIYKAVVVSRLLYGLSTAWLNAAELRRLQGFHCRCLRRILGIAPAYFSRVSNLKVLEQAGEVSFDKQLLQSQLILYGRVVRAPDTDPIRKLTFIAGTTEPATNRFVRCGRAKPFRTPVQHPSYTMWGRT